VAHRTTPRLSSDGKRLLFAYLAEASDVAEFNRHSGEHSPVPHTVDGLCCWTQCCGWMHSWFLQFAQRRVWCTGVLYTGKGRLSSRVQKEVAGGTGNVNTVLYSSVYWTSCTSTVHLRCVVQVSSVEQYSSRTYWHFACGVPGSKGLLQVEFVLRGEVLQGSAQRLEVQRARAADLEHRISHVSLTPYSDGGSER